jgi:Fic family protein
MAWPLADGPSSQLAEGLVAVLHDATQGFERPLDENRLFQWRSALKPSRATRRNGGVAQRYRTKELRIVSGQTSREIVRYRAPPATQVEAEMDVFLDWFARTTPVKSSGFSVDGLKRAAIAHLWLESIHPFVECNGVIARAVATMAMAQDTSTPALLCSLSSQFLQRINEYRNALNKARHDRMDASAWVQWVADAMGRSCLASCALLDNISSEKSQFWARHSQLDLNARQRKILQVLLANGDGGSLGGLNAAKYRSITGASKPTATRDLADLVRHGLLDTQGVRKALRYYICVPGWTHGRRP